MKLERIFNLFSRQIWKCVAVFAFRLFYPHNFVGLKNFIARRLVKHIGSRAILSPGFFVFHGYNFKSDVDCSYGYDFKVFDFEPVIIGSKALVSHGVTLIAGTHTVDLSRTYVPGPISIGDNVWIGANVVIVGPCEIGSNCIIGANSYVTGVFSENLIIGGTPAKVLRSVI